MTKKEKTLTISIAAYNVENEIRTALDSLMVEDIIDDLEILVVDDGGTDGTMKIAEEYAKAYPQSIFCIYKENEGYGSTINTSVRLATGKYFKQLDGDDWLVKKNVKALVEQLKKISADVVLTNSVCYYEASRTYAKGLDYEHLPEGEKPFEQSGMDTRLSMHTVIFRTAILKECGRTLTLHSLYTDSEFVTYPLPYLHTVCVYHMNLYVYRDGREEQSFNIASVQKHYKEMIQVFYRCLEVCREIDSTEETKSRVAHENLCERVRTIFRFFLALPPSGEVKQEMKDFQKRVAQECPEVLCTVRETGRTIDLLLRSRYLLYRAAAARVKRRWRTPVPENLLTEEQL